MHGLPPPGPILSVQSSLKLNGRPIQSSTRGPQSAVRNCLVIGGAGFIGRHVTRGLAESGREVITLELVWERPTRKSSRCSNRLRGKRDCPLRGAFWSPGISMFRRMFWTTPSLGSVRRGVPLYRCRMASLVCGRRQKLHLVVKERRNFTVLHKSRDFCAE